MTNLTGFTDGPSEIELLIADIRLWKENRDQLYLNPPEQIVQAIIKSEIEASKLLTRAIKLL